MNILDKLRQTVQPQRAAAAPGRPAKRSQQTTATDAQMADWGQWVEGRLASVAVNEKLHLRVTEVTRGPMTVTFTVRLLQPSPAALRRLETMGPAFAQALQVETVRISATAAGVEIEVPSPAPKTPSASWLMDYTNGTRVALGMDSRRRPVTVELEDYPSLLFVGPPRRGKTEAMKSAVYAMLEDWPVDDLRVVIVGRVRDWNGFQDYPNVVDIIGDHAIALQAVEWLRLELERRNTQAQIDGPSWLLVVDDLPFVLKSVPDIAGPMGSIASAGGAVSIYQFAATHYAGSKSGTGGGAFEETVVARVIYRMSSNASAARSAGAGGTGIEQLSTNKGDALLVLGQETKRLATAYMPEKFSRGTHLGVGEGGGSRNRLPWRDNNTLSPENQAEPGQNHQEPGRTTKNRAEPGMGTPPATGHAAPIEGGRPSAVLGGSARLQPVLPGSGIDELVERLRSALPDALPDAGGALLSSDIPPSPVERACIRFLHERLGSKNKTVKAVYGGKNGTRMNYVNMALGTEPAVVVVEGA